MATFATAVNEINQAHAFINVLVPQLNLTLVVSWLNDPFLYDMRPEFRDPAIASLHKALYLLKAVLDMLHEPSNY